MTVLRMYIISFAPLGLCIVYVLQLELAVNVDCQDFLTATHQKLPIMYDTHIPLLLFDSVSCGYVSFTDPHLRVYIHIGVMRHL